MTGDVMSIWGGCNVDPPRRCNVGGCNVAPPYGKIVFIIFFSSEDARFLDNR